MRVLVDATGGKKMGEAAVRRLEDAGCKFDTYHPQRLRNIGVLNERDHRKIIVLDGRTALVGGHCIVDSWLGDAQDGEHFRDLSVRLRGPIVHAIQSAFSENWVEETGELFVGEDFFPELHDEGDVAIHVARVKPEGSAPAVKILHHLAICCARERIWIQNPYFLPEPAAIEALGRAVARGVDVRVMVPSAEASDMPIVQHAAHRNFEWLLALGVRIFEYQKTLLHQKVMSIDGVWCAIGSSNFDDRSFEINDEITLGMMDAPLAREFEAIFERDSKDCVELELRVLAKAWALASPEGQRALPVQRDDVSALALRSRPAGLPPQAFWDHPFFRLSRTPLLLSFTSCAASFTLPFARSTLPSLSIRLSPVALPAASFNKPLALSFVPAMTPISFRVEVRG